MVMEAANGGLYNIRALTPTWPVAHGVYLLNKQMDKTNELIITCECAAEPSACRKYC